MKLALLIFFVAFAACTAAPVTNKVRYDNYKVFRMVPQTEEQLKWMKDVADKWELIDFWQPPSRVGNPVDVMLSPSDQLDVLNSFSRPDVTIETMIPNLQTLIDQEAESMAASAEASIGSNFDYNKYHTFSEIDDWMTEFAASNAGVKKIAVSNTVEENTVYGLEIKKKSSATLVAYMQGGIHAREWVSPATMIYMAKMLTEDYGSDSRVTNMLNNFIWIIVPVLNIDGYKYSHATNRMWRKNRNVNPGSPCMGVDLNRNYEYEWASGSNACGETYPGTRAMSEPETSGTKTFLKPFADQNDLKLFLDFHSYGQYWLYPWGYTRRDVPHDDKAAQRAVATNVEASISSKHGQNYFVGESGPDMYPAKGASEDFGYGTLGVKYSYVIELRDKGDFGFVLPENQIQPTAEEIYEGMKTLGDQLVKEYAS